MNQNDNNNWVEIPKIEINESKPTKFYISFGSYEKTVVAKTPYLALIKVIREYFIDIAERIKKIQDESMYDENISIPPSLSSIPPSLSSIPLELTARISKSGFVSPAFLRKEIDELFGNDSNKENEKEEYKKAWMDLHKEDMKISTGDAMTVALKELKDEGIIPKDFHIKGL